MIVISVKPNEKRFKCRLIPIFEYLIMAFQMNESIKISHANLFRWESMETIAVQAS